MDEEDLKMGIENFFFLLAKLEREEEEIRKQKVAETERKIQEKLMQKLLSMPKTLGKKSPQKIIEIVSAIKEDESTASQPHDPDDEEANEKYIPPITKIIEQNRDQKRSDYDNFLSPDSLLQFKKQGIENTIQFNEKVRKRTLWKPDPCKLQLQIKSEDMVN